MKSLSTYLNEWYVNEKLKLSDINQDTLGGEWESPKNFKGFDNFKEGYCICLEDGELYLYLRASLAANILNTMRPETEFVFMRKKRPEEGGEKRYYWINPLCYSDSYPKVNGTDPSRRRFDIKMVKRRPLKLKNEVAAMKELGALLEEEKKINLYNL